MLSHVNKQNQPTAVDVSGKRVSLRIAKAEALVRFPLEAAKALQGQEGRSKKGPVFDTAIVAGVLAAKKTSELIPMCHPLAIEDCKISIDWADEQRVRITCSVKIHHKTGVEMEALTGASIAALTIYDMCKALSHEICIETIQLLHKSGGKHDFAKK